MEGMDVEVDESITRCDFIAILVGDIKITLKKLFFEIGHAYSSGKGSSFGVLKTRDVYRHGSTIGTTSSPLYSSISMEAVYVFLYDHVGIGLLYEKIERDHSKIVDDPFIDNEFYKIATVDSPGGRAFMDMQQTSSLLTAYHNEIITVDKTNDVIYSNPSLKEKMLLIWFMFKSGDQ
jgi:hypothetical protein